MKPAVKEDKTKSPSLAWPVGDFYMPGFASDGGTGRIPGAPDTHRRLFLARAAELKPDLLATLRHLSVNDKRALSAWAERWHLTDRWCKLLARDTLRWWAAHPEARSWEFERTGIFAGFFPFKIKPLRLGPFYHDPTWRRRGDFKKDVLQQVNEALNSYCTRIEAAALAAGLKRSPRRRAEVHFDWLVHYQVFGESCGLIARQSSHKFSGGRRTVHKAIVELARYIELTLRPSTSERTR